MKIANLGFCDKSLLMEKICISRVVFSCFFLPIATQNDPQYAFPVELQADCESMREESEICCKGEMGKTTPAFN